MPRIAKTEADASDAPKMVRVTCIVHNEPWSHEGPMKFKETALVPADVAEILSAKDFVIILD